MKFTVTMKDPAALYQAIQDAAMEEVAELLAWLDFDEREELLNSRIDKTNEVCQKWFIHGEYLTVEIDTEAKTCVVVPK